MGLRLAMEVIDSELGPLTVVDGPRGLARIAFGRPASAHLTSELSRDYGEAVTLEPAECLPASRQLQDYFTRRRPRFDVTIDWRLAPGFHREVLRCLARVPYGELVSYGELARRAGRPAAARAVGGAMRSNRWPVVVPCHRVVASDGSIGGFTGGLGLKRALHRIEGILL